MTGRIVTTAGRPRRSAPASAKRRGGVRATPPMREQVKVVALDLLIRHGYHAVTFADLAKPTRTTRANIHYHCGTKGALVEEVLDDYSAATLQQLRGIWESPDVSLVAKIERTAEHSLRRYLS